MISSWAPRIPSSCSGSCTKWCAVADEPDSGITFMLDQCHNIEQKIPGQIRSVLNVQEMLARALLVDRDALAAAQRSGEVLAANAVFMGRVLHRLRPALADWREERGLLRDPTAAYAASGYQQEIETSPLRRRSGRVGCLRAR